MRFGTRLPHVLATLTTLLLVSACGTHPTPIDTDRDPRAEALLAAPPAEWPDVGPPARDAGTELSPALRAGLTRTPDAPGVQFALGLLGTFGGEDNAHFLTNWIREDRPHAVEAVISLGIMRAFSTRALLQEIQADPERPIRLRAAAASALLDLGDVRACLPMLHAILVAGTPQGRAASAEFGIPDKSRWKYERDLVIAAIRRHTGGEDYGLDADSPWPQLAEAAARFRDAMEAGR